MNSVLFATIVRFLLVAGLNLVFILYLARTLGSEDYGIFSISILLSNLVATICCLGGPAAITYYSSNQPDQDLLGVVKKLIFLCSILALIVLLIIGLFRQDIVPLLNTELILYVGVASILLIAYSVFLAVYQGRQDYKTFNALSLSVPLVWCLLLPLVYFFPTLENALIIWLFGWLIAVLISIHLLPDLERKNTSSLVKFLSFGVAAQASNILTLLNYRLGIIFSGFFLSASELGIFALAAQLLERLWIPSHAVASIFYPKLSENITVNTRQALIRKAMRVTFFTSIIFIVAFALFITPLVNALLGSEYKDILNFMTEMYLPIFVFALARVVNTDIAARGAPKWNIISNAVALFSTAILYPVLLPKYGLQGAFYGLSAGYFIQAMVSFIVYYRLYGLHFLTPVVRS